MCTCTRTKVIDPFCGDAPLAYTYSFPFRGRYLLHGIFAGKFPRRFIELGTIRGKKLPPCLVTRRHGILVLVVENNSLGMRQQGHDTMQNGRHGSRRAPFPLKSAPATNLTIRTPDIAVINGCRKFDLRCFKGISFRQDYIQKENPSLVRRAVGARQHAFPIMVRVYPLCISVLLLFVHGG